ncbi:MAG TPA: gluconate 2-dehydrogenase subunit 3 family protein [Polyangia bacterium]|nr:gluconate 2-dehydrogenase subunit 3 family protein [Polyangia bacterium]
MWSRRRFLVALLGAGLATGVALVSGQLGGYALDPATRRRLRALGVKEYVVLRAAARRILAADQPGAPSADEVGVADYVDGWLADADPATRRDFGRLLGLLEHGTPLIAFRRRRFTDLDPAAQDAYLRDFSHSRLSALREGFAALKSLCMLGYYRDPRTWAVCGYEGPTVPRGWAGGESAP